LSRQGWADKQRTEGRPLGPLHGLPVGVKDVFDTHDMPSEYGSETLRGRQPATDAAAVAVLRKAGAIVIGKTTTSEFGMYHPSPTRNPHDLSRSPGVSSAGSAAAVADDMVPLALGTQHTASTTLPASFCGVFALKPSLGFTSMAGSNVLVPRMAHVGLLARSTADLALFAGAFDPALTDVAPGPRTPRFGLVAGPGWATVDDGVREAFEAFVGTLPMKIAPIKLPGEFEAAVDVTFGLLNAHLAYRFGSEPDEVRHRYCRPLQDGIAAGSTISAADYLAFGALADRLVERASQLFAEHDALITLSAPSEATRLEDGPGSGSCRCHGAFAVCRRCRCRSSGAVKGFRSASSLSAVMAATASCCVLPAGSKTSRLAARTHWRPKFEEPHHPRHSRRSPAGPDDREHDA
jgi:Asp-tRNA(Asn)/Glu-tRNA(Gln) amidotransferase A subunit family amidase